MGSPWDAPAPGSGSSKHLCLFLRGSVAHPALLAFPDGRIWVPPHFRLARKHCEHPWHVLPVLHTEVTRTGGSAKGEEEGDGSTEVAWGALPRKEAG